MAKHFTQLFMVKTMEWFLICFSLTYLWASPVAQTVKNPPAMWKIWVRSWVGKIPWRRVWQPTPVFLPGESLWTEEPGGLQPMGSKRARHGWATNHSKAHASKYNTLIISPIFSTTNMSYDHFFPSQRLKFCWKHHYFSF